MQKKQEYIIISIIILLAYILRILPYLLGYQIPISDDALNDYGQVKYFLEHNQTKREFAYGNFPVLHIFTAFISKLGISPLTTFLFIPQIFPSIGLLFFYLFLKKYFPKKQSLLACLLIALFPPHLYWTAQPVRETIGLFFFPLIIYLFDKEISNHENNKLGISNKFLLIISFLLIIAAHNWSTVMLFVFLFSYSFFKINNKKLFLYTLSLMILFLILSITYWHFFFPSIFRLFFFFRMIRIPIHVPIILSLVILLFIIILRIYNLKKLKNNLLFIISLISSLIMAFIISKIAPFSYPIQIWISLLTYLIFTFIGFFFTKDKKMDLFSKICIIYILPIFASLFYAYMGKSLHKMPFDPIRILEFIIFPCSILTSYGLSKITKKSKSLLAITLIILTVLATLTYPPIFVYRSHFQDTPFYDIRGHIRYIPPEAIEIIDWANSYGYNIKTTSRTLLVYEDHFYEVSKKKLVLITKYDYILLQNYKKVNDRHLGLPNPQILINKSKSMTLVYTNGWGSLYKNENSNFP